MAVKDPDNLDHFLGNVDQINEMIRNLNSENEDEREKAIAAADKYLKSDSVPKTKTPAPDRTGVNRTVINKNAYNTPPQGPPLQPQGPNVADQGMFMKALEQDAQERSDRKKVAKAEATVFKDEGNEAFKSGDFDKAVQLYSKGLDVLKDFKELWTNRAQAYIKLRKFKDALTDCDWAERCDEGYVKAYVLEAKAHLGLLDYEAAINCYSKAMKIDKTKEKMMKGLKIK